VIDWRHYYVQLEQRGDMEKLAEYRRVIREAKLGYRKSPGWKCTVCTWMGRQLVEWGEKLVAYSRVAKPLSSLDAVGQIGRR